MRITERQERALYRLRKAPGGREHFSPELAKQLDRKGLARLTGRKYQRVEWNRPVVGSTLWEVQLVTAPTPNQERPQ